MYCASCGAKLDERSKFCEYCGTKILYTDAEQTYSDQSSSGHYSSTIKVNVHRPEYRQSDSSNYPISPKSRLITLLLWVFFGALGVHYFYVGRIGMGILWLVTGGLFGIGLLIDLIVILTGSFKDSFGRPIVNWD
ncbi:MAG: TM2 domain-containing protein [Candidatus Lokiarchaeota archaeon]|nr:TM2 domain-containing protein [Candidatus Lokiarchaeota archaeon]